MRRGAAVWEGKLHPLPPHAGFTGSGASALVTEGNDLDEAVSVMRTCSVLFAPAVVAGGSCARLMGTLIQVLRLLTNRVVQLHERKEKK